MKTILSRSFILFAGLSILLFACKKMEDTLDPKVVRLDLPETPYDYNTLNRGGVVFLSGISNSQATLGRVLFYDTHLSVNNTISCGSCHKQSIAFSDNVAFSGGFQNHSTLRNTLPIQNLSNTASPFGNNPSLFWDGRATFLPSMVLMPITNHVEMGMDDFDAIVEKVKALSYYNDLFVKAYGDDQINAERIATSLSTFVSSIFSGQTRFDYSENNLTTLSALEKEGKNLFFNKYNCNSCHQTQQLNGYEVGGGFVNIGLEVNYVDKGLENVTKNSGDNGKFKIPNLRNINLTGPYMHDGRFKTLSEVIDHYSTGIKNSPALDSRLRDFTRLNGFGEPKIMNITEYEKTALLAFLNTLTDYSLITDIKYSNPFKIQ